MNRGAAESDAVRELVELMQRSQALVAEGVWEDEAIRVNARIVELQPTADGALMRLARCYFQRQQWDEAAAAGSWTQDAQSDGKSRRSGLPNVSSERERVL